MRYPRTGSRRSWAGVAASHGVARQVMLGRAQGAEVALIDGSVGVVVAPLGRLRFAVAMTLADDRIIAMDVISDPARLTRPKIGVIEGSYRT